MAYTKRGTILDKNIIKELYIREGKTKKVICDSLPCSLNTLNKSIIHHNIENLLNRYVKFLFSCGKRHSEIGKIIKRDRSNISRRLSNLGIDGREVKQERTRETVLSIYGVDNIQKHPFFREKTTETNKKRYGYEHPLEKYNSHKTGFFEKNKDEILKKSKMSSYLTKKFIFPSGRIEEVQGAEPLALKKLLDIYHESEILVGDSAPIINYYDRKKDRKHYPDIFIPKENRIIEVKTTFTLIKTKSLMEKMYAATDGGYEYEIWVFDKNKELVEVIKDFRKGKP
jgi:hypothetical protein